MNPKIKESETLKRVALMWTVLGGMYLLSAWVWTDQSTGAQQTTSSGEPTIANYQTQVSKQKTTIAKQDDQIDSLATKVKDLRTQVAVLKDQVPTAVPTRKSVKTDGDVKGPLVVSPNFEIVNYYFAAPANSYEGFQIFGEIRNTSGVALDAPSLQFILLDNDGNIVDSAGALPLFEYLEADAVMPFHGSGDYDGTKIGEWTNESVNVCYGGEPAQSDEYRSDGLSLEGVIEEGRERTRLRITGKVRNGRDVDVSRVAVKAVVYDGDGRYVGDISDYLSTSIPTGKTATFEIDEGFGQFSTFNPLEYASGSYTYELVVGIDSSVRIGCR